MISTVIDIIRFIIIAEMAVIVAVTLRIWSVYAVLVHYFPRERRLLPMHVAFISVAHLVFALGMAATIVDRIGDDTILWNVTPVGFVAGTASIIALVLIASHEDRELGKVRQLIKDSRDLSDHK